MSSRPGLAASFLPNLIAGLTSGLVTLVYSISFAALIFSGKLTAYLPQGVGSALIGATVTAILVAWRSPFPFTLAGLEANSAIIITLAAASIASALDQAGSESFIYPTVWAAIILSTASTGLFLYALGRFGWGRLARYIPYPVIGGFLAGTGWLITRSSFKVMTGIPLSLAEFPAMFHGPVAAQWLCGAVMAAILLIVLQRSKHFLTLPAVLVGGIGLGNAIWLLLGQASVSLNHEAWFFNAFSHESLWQAWAPSTLSHIDWRVLFHQTGTLLAMMVIVMLSILLNSTGLELATSRHVDLDQELRANGIANIVNGCCGGIVGYLSINRCLLNQQAGARSPVAGMIAGGVCGSVLLLGSSFLAYVPKPVLGGLLLYIGYTFLSRWVYHAWWQFPRLDYCLIVVILIIIATLGFLQGVGAGLLIACLLFIVSYGKTSSIKHTLSGKQLQSNVVRSAAQQSYLQDQGDSIAILVLHGFVFFGTANDLLERIRQRLSVGHSQPLKFAVFDFRLVTGLDSSAVLSFLKLRQLADKSGLRLVFTQLIPAIENQLRQGGLFPKGASDLRCCPDLDRGLEWCEDQLLLEGQLLDHLAAPLSLQLEELLHDAESASAMIPHFQPVDIAEGQTLFCEGDPADGLYFLESGRASVVVELTGGRTLRRRTYTSGVILGEMGFYCQAPRSASVIADEPCRLHYLSAARFQRIEADTPHLASCFNRGVVKLVAERLRRSEEEVRGLMK